MLFLSTVSAAVPTRVDLCYMADFSDPDSVESHLELGDRRYRALVEATSQAVWSWHADGNHGGGDFERAQTWWQKITGQTVEEQRSRVDAWLDVVHPEDRDRASNAWGNAIAEQRTYDVEYRVRDIEGSWRDVHARGVPVRDADGRINEWIGTIDDITDQKRLEVEREALRLQAEAEYAHLSDVFSHAPSFMAVLRGPDHVFEMANDRYRQLVSGREIIGLPVRLALPEIQGQGYIELLDRVFATGEPHASSESRVQLLGSNGLTERVVEFVYQPLRDPSGAVSGVIVQGIDLTERFNAQRELATASAQVERQRRMYETAVSNTADFVYLFDTQGRFTFVNKALLDLWKKTPEEAVGKDFFDLEYPAELAARLQDQIQTVISTHEPLRDETPYTSETGTRFYEYIFVPVFGPDGNVEAVAGSTRDITERLASEEALREADRRKDEFIALLAHELRNPLAPIRTALQLIRMAPDRPEIVADSRDVMERQLYHLVRLVDDLMDVSRVSRNKMELRISRVPLADVIRHAVEAAEPLIKEAGHELSVEIPKIPLYLDADLTRLAQVFANLLTNSAKYTPQGGRIWISAEVVRDEVLVSVHDTGLGIPAGALSTIFDMFSQVGRNVERSTGGLGIGLALVRGLVEMHGGDVEATSEEGHGSTFTVRLPLAASTADDVSEPAGPPEPTIMGKRILVVDDNIDGAKSMAGMLRLMGNDVRIAHDGMEAYVAAGAFRPDVILMDVGMPRLNGLDAARRIRAENWGREMKIVALTGWGQEEDRLRSLAAGCDGHFVKPVDFAVLQKLVDTPVT